MKAVAVPYLVALILAVIILGVIGYWFLTSAGKGGGIANESFCRARLLQFCSDLRTKKIPSGIDFFSEDYAGECNIYKGQPGWPSVSPNEEDCKSILGI